MMIVYTIQSGDTLWKIAQSNQLALDALLFANPQITDPNQIFVGQVINIPQIWQAVRPENVPFPLPTPELEPEPPCTDRMGERPCIYLAREGESLESIGHSLMIPLSRLLYFNLRYGKREPLPEGARIIIPEAEIQPLSPLLPGPGYEEKPWKSRV
ncbi:MAG: LysM domain-containing protein [Bacillota bacterium]|nr:LysM domain-containing protein [Bacillota bacterium]